ncbi:hypothetical protein, partial [Salmonella sp. s57402]|uniref:hypothetical protein n=1 Tax=Salmonella sp. s57402 TaxID=3159695 RepID=UPI0039800DE6
AKMIIYRDITSESKDEIISDVYELKDVGDGLWEADLRMVTTGSEDFVLEGANPSAEGEDAEEGGETTQEKVLDIVQQFRLNKVDGMDKKAYT